MSFSRLQSIVKTLFYKAGFSIKRIRTSPNRVTRQSISHGSTRPDLMKLLHKVSPYAGFDFRAYALDAKGWGDVSPAFRQLIVESRPSLIVEVGTWKGGSALQMAKVTREVELPTQILCVDTWLGALEFWTQQDDVERYLALEFKHGYPTVYYQFLANVCHDGFQDRIVPFPQTSSIAAQWLRVHGITSELVYIDASHEDDDVYNDLCNYWPLVTENGILFGDDYAWDGVRLAVNRFAEEEQQRLEFIADKWILRKRA